jgi:UDP-glucose 4-epimerase
VRGWVRDLLDVEILNSTLSEGFDGVSHLATLSLVGESVEHPGLYYRTNVCSTLNLLDAMIGYEAAGPLESTTRTSRS